MSRTDTRFDFGRNWQRFLERLDEPRITDSMRCLRESLGVDDLAERSFLDIGSGSGLSSLAAHCLGARRVVSFDYDEDSVACTRELHSREGAPNTWRVEHGSALDADGGEWITGAISRIGSEDGPTSALARRR